MRQFKKYEPKQSVIIPFDPASHFPEKSFENFLVSTINRLNIDGFYTDEPVKGETPFNPKSLLGIIFYGIATGNFSSRKMERGCKNDFGFMYVSGFTTPDHATICRFIEKFPKQINDVFVQILYIADSCGYLDYEIIATDGTKIKASASSDFSGTLEEFKKKIERLEKKIEEVMKKLKENNSENERETLQKKTEEYKNEKEKIASFLKGAEKIVTTKGKEARQNVTDNDCRIMKRRHGYGESYNAQATGDSKQGILIATDVSSAAIDTDNFSPMLDKIKTNTKEKTSKSKYVFDNGYHSTKNIVEAEEKNIDAYISPGSDKDYYRDIKKGDNEKIATEDCTISKEGDKVLLTCPGGRVFSNIKESKRKSDGKESYYARVKVSEECEKCEHYDKCIGSLKNKEKIFWIDKLKVDNLGLMKAFQTKMQSEDGKKIYSRRMPTIERVFGCIKTVFGYQGTYRRGKENIKTEWNLICTTYNLKRMFSLKWS